MSAILVLFFVFFIFEQYFYGVMLSSGDFITIRRSPEFVDKTLLIREFLNDAESLVLAAPGGFGKTANLDMMRTFLSNTVDRKLAEDVFHGTKIFMEEELMKSHFCSHPVIYCSFKPEVPVADYDAMVDAFRDTLRKTFLQHFYLTESPHLTKRDLKQLKQYVHGEKYKMIKPIEISVGLYFLSQILEKHYGKQAVLLIDDYDSVILDSVFNQGLEIGKTIGFYNAVLSGALYENEHLNKSILSGTTCVSMKPLIDMENVKCVQFLHEKSFEPFFGLTDDEVDDLLGRDTFKMLREQRQDMKMWYDGYTSPDLTAHLYSTRSVLRFLHSGELHCFWNKTRGGNAFRVLLQDRVAKSLFSESSQNVMIVIRHLTEINPVHLEGLKTMVLQQVWDEDFSDLYVHLLMEKGYFTFDKPWLRSGYNSSLTVKFPNIEICESVRQVLTQVVEEGKNQRIQMM